MSEPAAADTGLTPQKLTQLETLKRRRRGVWRNVAVIALITFFMGLLSVAERDNQSLRGSVQRCHRDLDHACRVLQEELDQGRPAPANLPLPAVPEPADLTPAEREKFKERQLDRRLLYRYVAGHRWQARAGKPVVVCQDLYVHNLYMQPDQAHVILFDGQRYEMRTLRRADFAGMAGVPNWTAPK